MTYTVQFYRVVTQADMGKRKLRIRNRYYNRTAPLSAADIGKRLLTIDCARGSFLAVAP